MSRPHFRTLSHRVAEHLLSAAMNLPILKAAMVFFGLLLTPCLHSSEILGGVVAYIPPIPMVSYAEPGNAGLPREGTEFRVEGGTNGYAQVNFALMSIVMLFPDPSDPPPEIRTTT